MPPDGSLSRGASTSPRGSWGGTVGAPPSLGPIARQWGSRSSSPGGWYPLLLVGGGLAPSLRENLIGYICGSRDPVASSNQ